MRAFLHSLVAGALIVSHLAIASDCPTMFAADSSECEMAKTWGPENFSSPESLAGKKSFRLIFHSISGLGWGSDGPEAGSWNEKILDNPELISNNPKISASLISSENPTIFFGTVGLILESHPENMVLTSTYDVESPRIRSFDAEAMKELFIFKISQGLKIQSPDELLKETLPNHYNEVILTGKSKTGTTVKPTGVILRCDEPTMTRLNDLSIEAFQRYVFRNCASFGPKTLERLNHLRSRYPMFGYKLIQL